MTRIITPGASLLPDTLVGQFVLPIDRQIALYIRQSTEGQIKKNIQSKIQQDNMMRHRLHRHGWHDELIIPIDYDLGVSGEKRRSQRKGLDFLYHLIKQREIGAVAAYDASRLWRDITHVWYNDFLTNWIIPYNIVVITNKGVFYPSRQHDVDALREEFRAAAWQQRQIYDKTNPARLQAVELMGSYGGHCVPMGFIVVGAKGERHYVIYEAHAKWIRWLFKRYRELNGNLGKLGRELVAMHFAFPPFEAHIEKPHVALLEDSDGSYPLRTRGGLISILTNPTYLGYYLFSRSEELKDEQGRLVLDEAGKPKKVKQTVARKANHDSIVDVDDFMYAFNRLSPVTLEGEPNEQKPPLDRRYDVSCDALLENILKSEGNPVYVMADKKTYVARTFNDGWKSTELVANVAQIDRAVEMALDYLYSIAALTDMPAITRNLEAELVDTLTSQEEAVTKLEEDRKAIDQGIEAANLKFEIAVAKGMRDKAEEAADTLKLLEAQRAAIDAQIEMLTQEHSDLIELKQDLHAALARWHTFKFARKQQFIRLLVKHANIKYAAPHILQLDLYLRAPIGLVMTGYLTKPKGTKAAWAPEEIETICRLYPYGDRLDIMRALPPRSWASIVQQAAFAHVTRHTRQNSTDIHESLSYNDAVLMQAIREEAFNTLAERGFDSTQAPGRQVLWVRHPVL